MHTADDPADRPIISYDTYQAIDYAHQLGFEALAITFHKNFGWTKEFNNYAQQKNILLIPGIEATIEKKHVVILNLPAEAGCEKDAEKIKTFEDLKKYKNLRPQIFVLAPHPFVWDSKSLGKKLIQNIDLFDAIELTIFSNSPPHQKRQSLFSALHFCLFWCGGEIFNFNKKAKLIAKKYNKPLVATSDTHYLNMFKRGYCLIDVKNKTIADILNAIKNKKITNKVQPMRLLTMLVFRVKGLTKLIFKSLSAF